MTEYRKLLLKDWGKRRENLLTLGNWGGQKRKKVLTIKLVPLDIFIF